MKRIWCWLSMLIFLPLVGCMDVASTSLPTLTTITPTKQTVPSATTSYPTNTPVPCPPHLDTRLPEPNIPENYIGMIFRLVYPEELKFEFEDSILGDEDKGTDYSLALTINQNTGQKMFWLERELCTNPQRQTFYEIVDTLTLNYDTEQQEVVPPRSCWLNEIFTPDIAALGDRLPESEKLQNIQKAWKANRQTEKIEEISKDGIECYRYSGVRTP